MKRDEKETKKIVNDGYTKVAEEASSCCSSGCCCSSSSSAKNISKTVGYSDEEMNMVPEGANLGLGCGNPVAIASLKEGDTVLDLGAGTTVEIWIAGITAFVAECHHHGRQIISHKSHVV